MTAKGKILVVDDDRLVLATVTHGLAQAGYEVIDADNGDDAILLARKHRPELALLDIRMEGKSGFDVAEYLRDSCRIPFMFLSAFADPATVAKVAELGAVAYMVKPLDVGQIVPTVDAAFERLRAQAEAQRQAQAAQPAAHRADVVSLAAGVLMHRYSLSRGDALARLHRIADAAGVPLAEQAERLVGAVEELARPGAG
jgi:response regulator NasT